MSPRDAPITLIGRRFSDVVSIVTEEIGHLSGRSGR